MSGPFTRTGSWQLAWQRLVDNRAALVAAIILGLLSLAVIVGPWLSPYTLDETDWDLIAVAPDLVSGHWFGTDALGRDILVRSLEGGRISLLVGVVATLVSLVVGVSWGAIAGYIGGRVDSIMMRTVDVLYAMPFMFFVILLMVMFERNILLIFVAIGAINWLDMARIVRGQTISLKNRDFVSAARCMGASTPAI
ncbi:MAG: ABC transporter permease subunit, partial [Gammaproteobacteria bacterium]